METTIINDTVQKNICNRKIFVIYCSYTNGMGWLVFNKLNFPVLVCFSLIGLEILIGLETCTVISDPIVNLL